MPMGTTPDPFAGELVLTVDTVRQLTSDWSFDYGDQAIRGTTEETCGRCDSLCTRVPSTQGTATCLD
jgi:hypothetical protein